MKAFETITSDGTAVFSLSEDVHHKLATSATIMVASGSLSYRTDGGNPDTGITVPKNTILSLKTRNEIILFKGKGSCTLKVDYSSL